MPTEETLERDTIYSDETAEQGGSGGGGNPVADLGTWLASDDSTATDVREGTEDLLNGNYDRSSTFPATRPAWDGGQITAETREKWLGKAANGKGGLAPSAERLGAWYYLQSPTNANRAWQLTGDYLPASPWWPSQKAVEAVVWDLFNLDGFTGGRDTFTSDTGTSTPRTGGTSMGRPSGAGVGVINPEFYARPVGQAGRNGSTTGVLGGGDSPDSSGETDSTLLYVGGAAALAALIFAFTRKG